MRTALERRKLNDLIKKTGRTLQISAAVMPADISDVFVIAYLFGRAADTVTDTDLVSKERRVFWVKKLSSLAFSDGDAAELIAELNAASIREDEKELLQNLPFCMAVFKRFSSEDQTLIQDIVKKLCGGMLFDMDTFDGAKMTCLKTADELKYYCGAMGGAPGVFWSELINRNYKVNMPAARFIDEGFKIGRALQIVNILRDFEEDYKIKRVYLPSEDFEKNALNTEDLTFAKAKPVMLKWLKWGGENLKDAAAYYAAIPCRNWRVRLSVALPIIWCLDNLILVKNCAGGKPRIKQIDIYKTILISPLYLLSNKIFSRMIAKRLNKIFN